MKTGNRNIQFCYTILSQSIVVYRLAFLFVLFCGTNSVFSQTKVIKTDNGFQLMHNGQPYYVKGVGGQVNFDKMIEMSKKQKKSFSQLVTEHVNFIESRF